MAGTCTLTVTNVPGADAVTEYSLAWTSDASGNVSANQLAFQPGTIVTVEFTPGTAGSQPSNLYDVDFKDTDGTSMFDDGSGSSIGANLSNTLATHKVPFINGSASTFVRCWLQGAGGGTPYQLLVTNAGNTKSGTCNIYVCSKTL